MRIAERPAHEFWICEPDPDGDHGRELRRAELEAATKGRR
jgi:hypothetical protein